MKPIAPRPDGFTLLEVTIAMTVAVLLFLVIGSLAHTSTYAMDHLGKTKQIEHEILRALTEITTELKVCSQASLVVDTTGTDHDRLRLQVTDSTTITTPPIYGFRDQNGVFQPGWTAEYGVTEGNLVRGLHDQFGAPRGDPALLCRDVDDATDLGEGVVKGFRVELNAPLVAVTIRVRGTLRDGSDLVRTERTMAHMMNP